MMNIARIKPLEIMIPYMTSVKIKSKGVFLIRNSMNTILYR